MQNGYKNENPLISVIVPVYKVEPYLADCVESILAQTYKNIEVFLVDDGSPDRCGEICDEYAQKDSRVKVIHKENGGQSSARNAALSKISGDYISFVDSDDEIAPDMLEYLLCAMRSNNAQISVCGFTKCYFDGRKEIDSAFTEQTVYQGEEILKAFLPDEKIGSQPCNKLFDAELFRGVEFPYGRVYEDIAMMHRVFAGASAIVCLPEGKYFYKIRDNSTSFTQNARWAFGLYRAFADRYDFAFAGVERYSVDKSVIDILLSKACGFAISGMRFWKEKEDTVIGYRRDAVGFLRSNLSSILASGRISAKRKLKAVLIALAPKLYSQFIKKG